MIALLLIAIVAAIVIVAVIARTRRQRGDVDAPARLVANALRRLPAERHEWARAMLSELAYIDGQARRWRYAIGAVRVALLPPTRHPRATAIAAAAGLLIAATAAVAVYRTVPGLTVFVAVFGVTMCLYATARAARPIDLSLPYLLVAATALAAIGAAIAAIVGVAATHPAATADRTHVFSILLALILTGYIIVALLPPPATRRTGAVAMWWALGGAGCGYAVWITVALSTPPKLDGTVGYLWLVGAATAAIAAVGTAVTTRSSAAGIRAGVITAILTAPAHVALDITTQLNQQQYTLSSTYDITAYARGGYPDIASYLLSDTIGGEILVGLVFYPVLLCAVTVTCAALCGRRQPARPSS